MLVLVAIVLVLPHCSSAAPSLLPPAPVPSTGPAPVHVTVRYYVVDGTMIMIPSTVPNQTRQDVLYSLLVGLLAADKLYSRSSANKDWITFLDNTLGYKAWVTAKHSYS